MIRWHQRRVGVRFSPDCPDYVKKRTFNCYLQHIQEEETRPKPPLCDQPWVTLVDERISGWWFPFYGFVSDEALRRLASRVMAACAFSGRT